MTKDNLHGEAHDLGSITLSRPYTYLLRAFITSKEFKVVVSLFILQAESVDIVDIHAFGMLAAVFDVRAFKHLICQSFSDLFVVELINKGDGVLLFLK